MKIIGIDFTSAPRRAKPITVAHARLRGGVLHLETIELLPSFNEFESLLARSITRKPYKNDTRSKQTPERTAARRKIVRALVRGEHPLGLRVVADRRPLVQDPTGDMLDAVLCAVQAAWAAGRPNFGLPRRVIRCEGWIVSA